MNVPRPAAPGRTRTCPHCKATILESASVCPACLHHLRFDPALKPTPAPSFPVLKVEGRVENPEAVQTWEYAVVVSIKGQNGEDLGRHVVNVGALRPGEGREFQVSVEVAGRRGPGTN